MDSERDESLADPTGDVELIETVTEHLAPLLGEVELVLHEQESEFVHVDVHQFERADNGWQVYVTTGMASRPMNVPAEVVDRDQYRYAELILFLPESWPREWDTLKQPEFGWPLTALRQAARLPHAYETWLWGGHTVSNPDGEPYGRSSFVATLVAPSYLLPDEMETLSLPDGREIVFLTLAFLYAEELAFCKEYGSAAFFDRVAEAGLTPSEFFVLNLDRANVCRV